MQPRIPHLFASSRHATGNRAFTLIELLTVIAIIGILASILFVSIKSARKAAQLSTCVSNYRQVGIAILTYTNDNKGSLPGPMSVAQQSATYTKSSIMSGSIRTLHYYLRSYIELAVPPNSTDYYIAIPLLCPAWNDVTERYDPANNYAVNTSSPYSSELFRVNQSGFGYASMLATFPNRKLNAIDTPAKSWAVRELYDAANNTVPKPWHGKRANSLYFDGHVQTDLVPDQYQ